MILSGCFDLPTIRYEVPTNLAVCYQAAIWCELHLKENVMTKVKSCKCKHNYQDAIYGKQHRVCNKTNKPDEYRCTVCGSLHKG